MSVFESAPRSFPQVVSAVALVVYLAIVSLGCSTLAPSRPVFVDTLSVRDLYPHAVEIAKGWKDDAYLVSAETSFWPRESDEFRGAFFSFRSRSTDVVGLSVRYDPSNAVFSEEWLSVFKEQSRYKEEIAETDWQLDSVDALEIAQESGGREFLAAHLDEDLYLYVRLEDRQIDQDLRTVWFAAYYAGMPAGPELQIVIDAVTGEVLEVDG